MAKYGIPYQGSKLGIADSIISFLPRGKRFVDLFGGGFAMSECALKSGKYDAVLYNEINPLLPRLIKEAIAGKYNYKVFKPQFISREEFDSLKESDGYVKYIWSFSNGGKSYLFSAELEPSKKSLHNYIVFGIKDDYISNTFPDIDKYIVCEDIRQRRMLLRRYMQMKAKSRKYIDIQQLQQLERLQKLQQLQQFERLDIKCGSYETVEFKDGDVVYCDPPYESTAGYNSRKSNFDSKRFYEWVATRPYQVWFSSYQNISDRRFRMVWAKGKTNLMAGGRGQKRNYECIYTNR